MTYGEHFHHWDRSMIIYLCVFFFCYCGYITSRFTVLFVWWNTTLVEYFMLIIIYVFYSNIWIVYIIWTLSFSQAFWYSVYIIVSIFSLHINIKIAVKSSSSTSKIFHCLGWGETANHTEFIYDCFNTMIF